VLLQNEAMNKNAPAPAAAWILRKVLRFIMVSFEHLREVA